jgi:hypothetical protein
MAYCEDRRIHLKIRSLRKVVHTFCGKPVNNLSKAFRKVLILLALPWFAISCGNSKTPVVSATIEETEYTDMVDLSKNPILPIPCIFNNLTTLFFEWLIPLIAGPLEGWFSNSPKRLSKKGLLKLLKITVGLERCFGALACCDNNLFLRNIRHISGGIEAGNPCFSGTGYFDLSKPVQGNQVPG